MLGSRDLHSKQAQPQNATNSKCKERINKLARDLVLNVNNLLHKHEGSETRHHPLVCVNQKNANNIDQLRKPVRQKSINTNNQT
jgi:hypothetical protein